MEDLTPDHPQIGRLKAAAEIAARNAYCPYSKFPVGAAVLAADGRIFAGCNVENASYGLTICAERSAIFQAVAAGHAKIHAVVIVTPTDAPTLPCGACRQVINEFGPEAEVFTFARNNQSLRFKLSELLPLAFGPSSLP